MTFVTLNTQSHNHSHNRGYGIDPPTSPETSGAGFAGGDRTSTHTSDGTNHE